MFSVLLSADEGSAVFTPVSSSNSHSSVSVVITILSSNIKKVKLSGKNSLTLRGKSEYWASFITLTFGTIRKAGFSALHASRTLSHRKSLGTYFFQRLSGPQFYWMRSEEIGRLKISKHHTWNQTRNVPSIGAEPQAIPPLRSSNILFENTALTFPTENRRI